MTSPPPRFGWPHVFLTASIVSLAGMGWTLGDGPLLDDNPLIFTAQADSWLKIKLLLQPHLDVYWRPFAKLTLVPGAALFGFATWPHRLTALLLHALATTLVWSLARRLADARAGIIAGLLFLVHPLHIGAMYWISARYDLTATVLTLAAVLTAQPHKKKENRGTIFWPTLLTFLACLSKETALVIPLLIGLTFWTAPETRAWRRILKAMIGPVLAVCSVLILRYFLMGRIGGPLDLWPPHAETLQRLLFGIPYALAFPTSILDPTVDGFAFYLFIIPIVWLLYLFLRSRRDRLVWYGPLFMVISSLPVAGFIYLGAEANTGYMLYQASAGACLFVAFLWPKRSTELTRITDRPFIPAVLLVALGIFLNALTLPAYHAASQTIRHLVKQTLAAEVVSSHPRLLLDIPINRIHGVTMFYDEVAEFFLPEPPMTGKEIYLVNANFWRRAGAEMSWRDPAWQEQTAVLSWPTFDIHSGGRDQTASVQQAWRRRARSSTSTLTLKPQCPHIENVTCLPGQIAWRRGPITIPLQPEVGDEGEATIDVSTANAIHLPLMRITTPDVHPRWEGNIRWTPLPGATEGEARPGLLFDLIGDGMAHDYLIEPAVDPRWAVTEGVVGFSLELPFRDGALILTE